MLKQVSLNNAIGKTIKRVVAEEWRAWVLFADETFAYVEAECTGEDAEITQPTVALNKLQEHDLYTLRRIGVITEQDEDACREEIRRERESRERDQYEFLRKKFEGPGD